MSRFLLVLVSAMMMSAALSGCFGEDTEDDDDTGNGGNGNGNGGGNNTTNPNNGGNNTTTPQVTIAPTPAFSVSMAQFDEEGGEASNESGRNFTASPSDNVTFTFDGSASTDEDGTIEAYSWQVIAPDGTEYKDSGPVLWFRISSLKSGHFGIFKATLKVLDNDNVLNSAEFFVPLNYVNQFGLPAGMDGPGTDDCNDAREEEAGSELEGTTLAPGTYAIHKVTIGPNATLMDLNLEYDAAQATSLAMFVLPPEAADDACGEAIATAPSGSSPLTLSITEGLDLEGQYKIRVELDGVSVNSYTIDVAITYTPPIQQTEEPAEEEEEPPAEG